ITLDIGPSPRPIAWRLDLKQPPPRGVAGAAATLAIGGRYDRWWQRDRAPKDVEVTLAGRQWPWTWTVAGAGLSARGVLDGGLAFQRRSGLWAFTGNATLAAFEASGPLLAGDRLRLDRMTGSWDVEQTAGAWAVRRLELKSPIASLTAAGRLPAPPG